MSQIRNNRRNALCECGRPATVPFNGQTYICERCAKFQDYHDHRESRPALNHNYEVVTPFKFYQP